MRVFRLAAFSDGDRGGNPAGVYLLNQMLPADEMQERARDMGFSETVFAAPSQSGWHARYFSPLVEVQFCGHATLALGAALAMQTGGGSFLLQLNASDITVTATCDCPNAFASLLSPPAHSRRPSEPYLRDALTLFDLNENSLSIDIPPRHISAGADHLVLKLRSRAQLAEAAYDFAQGKALMEAAGWNTIMLVFEASPSVFHVRNFFASGGVYEDPATGAAAAAFAAYLHELGHLGSDHIELWQGDDMGVPSRLTACMSGENCGAVGVSGQVRVL